MKQKLDQHILSHNYVKVYITDKESAHITHFAGIVFDQTDDLVLMSDTNDFDYDGLIVLRKNDISEIKHTDNERFVTHILEQEGLRENWLERRAAMNISLAPLQQLLEQVQALGLPIIAECRYKGDDIFQVGPIHSVTEEHLKIQYFNANGEYDLKPTLAELDAITFLRIDSPYANLMFKYAAKAE